MVVHLGEQAMTLFKRIFANGWQSVLGGIGSLASLLAPAVPALLLLICIMDIKYLRSMARKSLNLISFGKL